MNSSKKYFFVVFFVLFIFASGVLGGVVGSSLTKEYLSSPTIQSGSIVTQEITKEKLVSSAISEVVQKASPSVVSIVVTKELVKYRNNPQDFFMQDPFFNDFFGGDDFFSTPRKEPTPEVEKERRQVAGGTGFIVSSDGKVVTNKHVVSITDAEYTVILKDGTEFPATIVSRDPSNDLALLQITKGEKEYSFPSLPLASSKVEVGQFVVAIGNALGEFQNTVTMGVISAENRKIVADDNTRSGETLTNLLQTDAAINPGNSGGPLLNLEGEVLGVNTAIAAGANGIGFAIPVSEVSSILSSVASYGKIVRPFLGIMYTMNSPEVAKVFNLSVDYGAIVQEGDNIKDSPAQKSGIIPGDIIIAMNGKRIDKNNDLKDSIGSFKAGENVEVTILRGKEELKKTVTLGKREDDSTDIKQAEKSSDESASVYIGIHTKEITEDVARTFGLSTKNGLLIYNDFTNNTPGVAKDSPADKAGLQSGDVLTKVDDAPIKTNDDMAGLLKKKKAGDKVSCIIIRQGKELTIEVTLEERKE